MAEYLTPAVYVEEIPAGPRPIQSVGTRTAAFIGTAPLEAAPRNEAYPVNNWLQFVREYVGDREQGTELSTAVYGFFQNGGSRYFIVNTAANDPVAGAAGGGGLRALEAEDEVAIVAAPGRTDAASYDALLAPCENLRDRVAILDGPLRTEDIGALTRVSTTVRARGEGRRGANSDAPGQRPRASDGGYGAFYFAGIITTLDDLAA